VRWLPGELNSKRAALYDAPQQLADAHNPHNTHKCPDPGNSADIADSAEGDSELLAPPVPARTAKRRYAVGPFISRDPGIPDAGIFTRIHPCHCEQPEPFDWLFDA
jgi:hypothetical protein